MLQVITGGSGSGKSSFAENQVMGSELEKRIYIATMIPYGEEGARRVERHRKMRAQKNFQTLECYLDLEKLKLEGECAVLLECMSNLTANEFFREDGPVFESADEKISFVADKIEQGIHSLKDQAKELYIVTNEVFSDGIQYDPETENYIKCLAGVNKRLARMADSLTEVVFGIPISIKEPERK